MSNDYVIVESIAGTLYLGKVFNNTVFDLAVENDELVTIYEVYKIVVVNAPTGPGNIARITRLIKPEFCEVSLSQLKLRVSSFYRLSDNVVDNWIEPELRDIEERHRKQTQPALVLPVTGVPPSGFDPRGRIR